MPRLLALVFILIFSDLANATMAPRMYSIMTQVNASLAQSTDAAGSPTYNNKLSLEVLYLVRNGPTFGARYLIESRNENESNSGQAYGPMAGYYSDTGFFALFTYDILAKLGHWTNGEGFEFGAGYLEHIGNQLHVGARLSTRKIRYKTDINNNVAIQKDVADTFPSVTFMYLF